MQKKWWILIGCVFVSLLAGAIGSVFTSSAVNEWYPSLVKPNFNPPSWVFGPVWTVLYVLIGVALFLVIKNGISSKNKAAVKLFGVQWVLNAGWSLLFFAGRSPLYALVDIVLLWLSIVAMMIVFYKHSKAATYLLVPYLLWVTFASILNLAIVLLN